MGGKGENGSLSCSVLVLGNEWGDGNMGFALLVWCGVMWRDMICGLKACECGICVLEVCDPN